VRAIDIELCAKAVERVLLRSQCRGRRVGSVVLERAVHALMAPVLLWLARIDPFTGNSKLDQPHGQLRQTANCRRCKRRPIVGTYRFWPPELTECRLHDRANVIMIEIRDHLTAQQIPAERVAQRKRITALPIA